MSLFPSKCGGMVVFRCWRGVIAGLEPPDPWWVPMGLELYKGALEIASSIMREINGEIL